ncbi:MAG: hypothetical protein ACT4TC_04410 [Myxococcaceae bacterium]
MGRPVSFVGSTMVMSTGQPMMASLTLDHTPFRRFSFGLNYQWLSRRDGPVHVLAPQSSLLAFRYNALEWQANAFATVALGGLRRAGQNEAAGFVALEADAESRRWYVLAGARYLRGVRGFEDFQATGRVGLAPFQGEFDVLNPWVVLQYQYMPGFDSRHVITPMLRLLYQGVQLEVGSSLRGEWTVNFAAEL